MKEKIVLIKEVVNENDIDISNEHTSYCRMKNIACINILETLNKYKSIIKLAKEQGIKLSYKNSYKRKIEELKEDYFKEVVEYKYIYNELAEGWKMKLKKGLYCGLVNDVEYQYLSNLHCKLQTMHYGNTAISKIGDINNSINDLYNDLIHENNLYSISL